MTTRPWPGQDGRRVGGVSSFGFSGTNAHVVLSSPSAAAPVRPARPPVLALSARDAEGLDRARAELRDVLTRPDADLAGLSATLTAGCAHHPHRIAFAAGDAAQALEALDKAAAVKADAAPAIGLLFTGQGCQYPGMARGLMAEPAFAAIIEQADVVLGDRLAAPLSRLLRDGIDNITRTDRLQPVLFAIEVATAALWKSWGVEASMVIGHSVGEVAAACHAGILDFAEGLSFMVERGRLMEQCAGRGGMAALLADEGAVQPLLAAPGAVIAALNAPGSTVLAGDNTALEAVLRRADAAGTAYQRLEVATAFHSPVLDPVLDGIATAAGRLSIRPARLPVASNLTGEIGAGFDATYWRAQARAPVRFIDGMRALAARGVSLFLEVGPQPVLSGLGRRILPQARFIAGCRRGAADASALAEAAAALHAAGAAIDWNGWHGGRGTGWRPVAAPAYPFRRDRHWVQLPERRPAVPIPVTGVDAAPLLGTLLDTPVVGEIWQSRLSPADPAFLADHVVFGRVVAPGAMHAVLGLMLAARAGHERPAVADLVFAQALEVPADGMALSVTADGAGGYAVCGKAGADWVRHAAGRLLLAPPPPPTENLPGMKARMEEDGDGPAALFAMLDGRGIHLGDSFKGLHRIWRGQGEALAEIRRPDSLEGRTEGLPLHPALLDSCFQLLGATFAGPGTEGGFMPLSVDLLALWRRPGARFHCHARIADSGLSREVAMGHFRLLDDDGTVLMAVEGLQIKRVAAPPAADPVADAILAVDWVPAAEPAPTVTGPDMSALLAAAAVHRLPPVASDGFAEALDRLAAACAGDALPGLAALPTDLPLARARLRDRVRALAAGGGGQAMAADLRVRFPDRRAEIDLVARCGAGLADVLAGRVDPLSLLFAGGAEGSVYEGPGLAAAANAMAGAVLAGWVQGRPRPRVLEIGGGTGATTASLLPHLPPGADYLFTDIAQGFLDAAARRFQGVEGFRTALFDLEKPPVAQGLPPAGYDLIVAANVVHATADIARAAAHMAELLTPGGMLLVVESTRPQDWWDIVFGLTDGWWRFTDEGLRPAHPLLDAARWRAVLMAAGLEQASDLGVDETAIQSLLLARKPQQPWLLVGGGDLAPAIARHLPAVAVENAAEADLSRPWAGVALLPGGHDLRAGFDLARRLALAGGPAPRLVTLSAQGEDVTDPDGAMLWGLGRVLALEHPELDCRRIDLDADADAAALLAGELAAADGEAEVMWRDGKRLVSRLVRAPLPATEIGFDAGGAYLVLGAQGGLGPHLARWLARNGAGTVHLAGRRPAGDPPVLEGATLCTHVVDVTDAEGMTALLAGIPNLKGVFHLAGSTADGALINQDWDRFATVLPAKVEGARILDRLTRSLALDHFVLFSSSAALIGNRGQANHAAANAYLCALAASRRREGLPGLAVDWGAWGQAGAVVSGRHEDNMAARGVRGFPLETGFAALGRMMATGTRARYGFIDVDWTAFLSLYRGRVPPYLAGFAPLSRPVAGLSRPVAAARDFRVLLASMPVDERRMGLLELLRTEAAAVLGLPDSARIDPDQALSEMGLDSLLALELRSRMTDALGAAQPATLLFNYPSVAALADYAVSILRDLFTPSSPDPKPVADDQALIDEVAGMSEAELEAFLDGELAALGTGP